MAALHSNLVDAAKKNDDLLYQLRQTEGAPSSLKQTKAYIEDLEAQI
jgi:hypothetical protein